MRCEILKIVGREIIDSRGNPTVEAEVHLTNGISARASVPSGASTGKYEAVELRDGDMNRFHGKGVSKAVENINTIINSALKGMDASDIYKIDNVMKELDGTRDKSKLGAIYFFFLITLGLGVGIDGLTGCFGVLFICSSTTGVSTSCCSISSSFPTSSLIISSC